MRCAFERERGSLPIRSADNFPYVQRSCQYDFPDAFTGLKKVSLLNALTVDSTYGGWDTTTERLIFANGERK